ncbi:MAG: type II secretion system secretin GspD [Burkholderiales bacterium]|nr:type II secretion system secretin GspD [Rhodocyclaceae bacterium]MCA3053422.1 type II secretion system secretin GspD [Rhodocyclaceae bacterium]MCA3055067.1 type II secretion system secretin GspD [Rhodocyclaceae bacterium]
MKLSLNRRTTLQQRYAPKLMLVIATAAALSLSSTSGIAPAVAQDNITMSFVNADIRSVIETIGKATGKNFIIDPRVTGNMNIVSQTPVTKDLAYEILLSTLRVHGFAAIEERGAIKVVPEADAKTSGSLMAPGVATKGDRIVTQVFALQNESAAQLATVLRPLVAQNNFIGAYPGNNTLVITDYASNVERIRKIISAIDVPVSSDLQTVKLQYASAVDIANTMVRLLPEASANPSNPGAPAKLSVGVEPRTNSLIIRADSPALITRLRALVAQIDTPTAANGNINVVYLKNAEATKIAETLRGLMGGASASTSATPAANNTGAAQPNLVSSSPAPASNIQAYAATNSLIITAPDHVYNALRSVIDKLDQRRAQVYVEALIVEVTSSVAAEFGIQWQDLTGVTRGGAQVIGGTNFGGPGTNIITGAQNIGTIGQGLNIGVVRGQVTLPGIGTVLNLGALARALENDQRANVLSTPNILTLDNEEAKIVVGQNVPFVTGSYTQSTSIATNPFQTIERKDIGLTLRVTPQVAEGGAVKLKVFQEVSSVVPTSSTVRSADLITNKRSIENTVLVDDGQTVVIGGLISDDAKNGDSRVPLLGDIPVIGNLFKYQTRSREKTNLMVFLRPLVIRDSKIAAQLTGSRYDYIRGEQAVHLKEADSLLPPAGGPQLSVLPLTATPPMESKAAEKK